MTSRKSVEEKDTFEQKIAERKMRVSLTSVSDIYPSAFSTSLGSQVAVANKASIAGATAIRNIGAM